MSTPFRALALHGEQRANLLRAVAIAAFYLIELLALRGLELGPVHVAPAAIDPAFHRAATAIALAWAAASAALWFAMRRQLYHPALGYAATALDLVLLTALISLASGPRSPLCVAYPLIIAAAGMRLDLALVRASAVGAALAYLALQGDALRRVPEHAVPAYHAAMAVAALIVLALIVGQIVRTARLAVALAAEEPGP